MIRAAVLLIPLLAQAQDAPPACSPWAAGRGVQVVAAGAASCISWACRSADRYAPWSYAQACVAPAALAAGALDALTAAVWRQDMAAALALRDRPLRSPEFGPALAAAAASYVPPAGPWTVAPLAGQTSRPTRALVGQAMPYTLGTALPTRAPVGATCDCTRRVIAGTTTWCAVPSVGGTAAVCRELAP
jgi:hypothetical protein